jgi:hypothetical protein
VAVTFKILDMGPYFETQVWAFYRLKGVSGKRPAAGRRSRLVRDLQRAGLQVKRSDRLPIGRLRGLILKGRVRTVDKDGDGDPLPEEAKYSVLDKILGRVGGA